jgi:hypothetical protein
MILIVKNDNCRGTLAIDSQIRISASGCGENFGYRYYVPFPTERNPNYTREISYSGINIEPFSFKEGMVQYIDGSNCTPSITFLTLNGQTISIPGRCNYSAGKMVGLSANQIKVAIEATYMNYYCLSYEEREPSDDEKELRRIFCAKSKIGVVLVNGIKLKTTTPGGVSCWADQHGLHFKSFHLRRWEEGEWEVLLVRRSQIARLRFEHPRTESFTTQYFKKGMIGVIIPDGSLLLERNTILTPSGKVYKFESSGYGRGFGYYCFFDHVVEEEEKKIFFNLGFPVKGKSVVDKLFGVTNTPPNTID